MTRLLLSLLLALMSLSFVAPEVQAARLGKGASSGMKRQTPPPQQQQQQATPAKPAEAAAPAAAATPPAPAAAPKRSWLGPLAGLAAGLGLAALFSHFGMGEGLSNVVMMVLLAGVAFVAIRFLLRRFGPQPAAPQGMAYADHGVPGISAGSAPTAFQPPREPSFAAPASAGNGLPAGFDAAGFERIAKLIFIRMQAANDAADLEDLRRFATPEMFANFRLDLQDRKGSAQQTDVVQLDAQVLDFEQASDQQVVSVRFHGLIREDKDAAAAPFDEVWHLVKPSDGSREWAIAGIAQAA